MFGSKKDKAAAAEHQGAHAQHASVGAQAVREEAAHQSAVPGAPEAAFVAAGSVPLKKKRSLKPLFITFGVLICLLAAVYGAGAYYFSGHFFPNTSLNDWDLSLQSSDSLANDIQSEADSYSLTIEGDGFSRTFENGEAAIDISPEQIASDAVAAQNNWLWFVDAWQLHDISDVIVASYDESAVADTLRSEIETFNADKSPSENAKIIYDSENDIFSYQEEVYGTQLSADAVIAKVDESIKSMKTTCDLTKDELVQPTVVSTDPRMLSAIKTASEMFTADIPLTLNGSVQANVIGKEQFASWLTIDNDYNPTISQDAISAWVDTWASSLNTVGTQRSWTRADGKQCTSSGGSYGWEVDTSSLAQTIYDSLTNGGAASIDIPCSQTADVYSGAGQRDWGSYVDIDLSEQIVRYYDANNNLLHQTDCISGLPSNDRATPAGIYMLNSKSSPQMLVGRNDDGSEAYRTEVKYWMPFIRNSIGLHDATWQSSFGGELYKSRGSHGCINLSLSEAQWFYENLTPGICVITHY